MRTLARCASSPTARHEADETSPSIATTLSFSIRDRKSTRLNSSHSQISYAVFCLKKNNLFVRAVAVHDAAPDLHPRPNLPLYDHDHRAHHHPGQQLVRLEQDLHHLRRHALGQPW